MRTCRLAWFWRVGILCGALSLAGCGSIGEWFRAEPESIRQWRRAEELFEDERYSEAAVAYRSWLADYHDTHDVLQPDVMYKLAECHRLRRDTDSAIRVYKRLIELHGDSPEPKVKELIETVVKPMLDRITPKTKTK